MNSLWFSIIYFRSNIWSLWHAMRVFIRSCWCHWIDFSPSFIQFPAYRYEHNGTHFCKYQQNKSQLTLLDEMSYNLFFILIHNTYVRSIIVTWLIVTVSAIPVAISHGIEEYYNHRNEINTACQFLSDEGYNHAAFQVSFWILPISRLFAVDE